jgi:hypothetical protein
MDEREAGGDQSEDSGAYQENGPRSEQRSEVHDQRSNEHESDVERTANPGALIEPETDISFEIGQTKREQSSGQCHDSCAENHSNDSQHRAMRQVHRQHGGEG